MYRCDISQEYRSSILDFQNDIFEVFKILDVTASADEEFSGRYFECFSTGVLIALPDGIDHLANGYSVGEQLVWIQIDLILLYKSADRCDLGHTFNRFQGITQIPVLDGT